MESGDLNPITCGETGMREVMTISLPLVLSHSALLSLFLSLFFNTELSAQDQIRPVWMLLDFHAALAVAGKVKVAHAASQN